MTDALSRVQTLGEALVRLQRPIRILRTISWPDALQREFFRRGAQHNPQPVYCWPTGFQPDELLPALQQIETEAPSDHPAGVLLAETSRSYQLATRMLAAVGTSDFSRHSAELYGRPDSPFLRSSQTTLALARHFDDILDDYGSLAPREDELTPEDAAALLQSRIDEFFGPNKVQVELADDIGSSAAAGAEVIRLKRANHTKREIEQLAQHEGFVHVATSRNGRAQKRLPFLGYAAPRTTRTQEGLAIFSEFITQHLDLGRLRRLSDRILAIQLSQDGADFVSLYRFFLGRDHDEGSAFECARRVVRGGLVQGGGPFMKDVCYLDGLARVHAFLKVSIARRRPDWISLLFVGKLDLDDIPRVAALRDAGAITAPRYIPDWARNLPWLTAWLSYTSFLQGVDLDAERSHYQSLVDELAPIF
jgi:uncharacterized protein (TIGR02421 family)